jgi:putative membrane protein
MSTWTLLRSAWTWNPAWLAGCALLVCAYGFATRWRWSSRAIGFASAVALLLLALVSPIAVLGDTYLLSAHMLQHFILVMVVPPLLVASLPAAPSPAAPLSPIACWITGTAAMVLWHVPALSHAAWHRHGVQLLEQMLLLAGALIFWWPVFSPRHEQRLHPVAAVVYLATACLCCTAIGVFLVFAPEHVYSMYLNPDDRLGALSLIRNDWGISPRLDQQLGGLLMWVPGCLVYLSAMLARIGAWYASNETSPFADSLEPVP